MPESHDNLQIMMLNDSYCALFRFIIKTCCDNVQVFFRIKESNSLLCVTFENENVSCIVVLGAFRVLFHCLINKSDLSFLVYNVQFGMSFSRVIFSEST